MDADIPNRVVKGSFVRITDFGGYEVPNILDLKFSIRNYSWSKEFLEAGEKRLAGDTARAANTDEVKELRREAKDLKEVVAEQTLELRLLKKACWGMGATTNEVCRI